MTADHPALDHVVLSTRRNTWTLGGEVEFLTEMVNLDIKFDHHKKEGHNKEQ